jgi:hypothetical protein
VVAVELSEIACYIHLLVVMHTELWVSSKSQHPRWEWGVRVNWQVLVESPHIRDVEFPRVEELVLGLYQVGTLVLRAPALVQYEVLVPFSCRHRERASDVRVDIRTRASRVVPAGTDLGYLSLGMFPVVPGIVAVRGDAG